MDCPAAAGAALWSHEATGFTWPSGYAGLLDVCGTYAMEPSSLVPGVDACLARGTGTLTVAGPSGPRVVWIDEIVIEYGLGQYGLAGHVTVTGTWSRDDGLTGTLTGSQTVMGDG